MAFQEDLLLGSTSQGLLRPQRCSRQALHRVCQGSYVCKNTLMRQRKQQQIGQQAGLPHMPTNHLYAGV